MVSDKRHMCHRREESQASVPAVCLSGCAGPAPTASTVVVQSVLCPLRTGLPFSVKTGYLMQASVVRCQAY